ncbi:hypothetical protein Emag_004790 [Eimeria magna]
MRISNNNNSSSSSSSSSRSSDTTSSNSSSSSSNSSSSSVFMNETESNRQLIRGLIQKWMRPVLGLGSSHRQLMSERERAFEANDSDLQQKLVKLLLLAAAAAAGVLLRGLWPSERASEQQAEKRRRTARIPFNRGHNFLIQPRSQVDLDETENKQQASSQVRIFHLQQQQQQQHEQQQQEQQRQQMQQRQCLGSSLYNS